MNANERMWMLGADTWRLYLDLDRQDRGSAAFDAGIGGTREPGYMASVSAAHEYAAERAEATITIDDYRALQGLVSQHAAPDEFWRPGRAWVHAPRVAIEPGIEEEWTALGVSIDASAATRPGWVRIMLPLHAGDPEALAEVTIEHLNEGQRAIDAARSEDRMLEIARLHQRLELLHPTRDTNTRRHLVVLQWLLARAGFLPSLLTEPNHVYCRRPDSWARCIREGVARTRAVHHAHQRGLDVAKVLTDFDVRHRPLGSGIGRWHRPESVRAEWVDPLSHGW